MIAKLQRLRAEIKSDRQSFADHVHRLKNLSLDGAHLDPGDLAQAAVALHHAYSAVEAIMERITRTLEGELPQGADWHQALLHDMCLDIEGVRLAVFSVDAVDDLRHLLGFRHFFRHAYAVVLDGARLSELRRMASKLVPILNSQLDEFDRFLKELIDLSSH